MPLFTIGGALLVGGLASAAVGVYGDSEAAEGQQQTNATNVALTQQQEDWENQQRLATQDYDTQMSDTAVQRRMQDLQAAGVNPMLAAGSPASAPTSSAAQVATPQVQNPDASYSNLGGIAQGAMNSVVAAQSAKAQVDVANANAANIRANTADTLAKLPYSGATAEQQLSNLQEQQSGLRSQSDILAQQFNIQQNSNQYQMEQLKNNTAFQAKMQDLQVQAQAVDLQRAKLGLPGLSNDAAFQQSMFGKLMPYIQGIGKAAGSAGAALGVLAP